MRWPDSFRNFVKRHTTLEFRQRVYALRGPMWAGYGRVVQALCRMFAIPVLWLLEPILQLRIGELRVDHLGHLAIETEMLLRQLTIDGARRATLIFVARPGAANRQLYEMVRRRIKVVEIRSVLGGRTFRAIRTGLERRRFYLPMPGAGTWWRGGERSHEVMAGAPPQLSFTADEEARGQADLRRMGIPAGAWFVAFHARDPGFYEALNSYRLRFERTYRDMDVETMFDAMQLVAAQGGYAIRMGSVVQQALPDLGPQVIDYATKYRSEFLDIYLCAKARFMMASNSGLASIAQMMDVPVGISNVFPYNIVPSGKGVRYLRMFLRDRASGTLLSFPEIKRRGLLQCQPEHAQEFDTQQYYDDRGLEVVHNDAEDIQGLCMDMLDLTAGRQPEPAAIRLQAMNRMLYDGIDRSPEAAQIGARFALRHANLIEPNLTVPSMSDRELLLARIRNAPTVDLAFAGILELANHDALLTAPEWYGDALPAHHAVCMMASLPASAAEAPYLHTASFGKEAYETYHTYHYLLDLTWFREFPQLVESSFVILDAGIRAIDAPTVEFLELGSSLYAAAEKFENCQHRSPGRRPDIRYLGVEASDWLRKIAALCHPTCRLEQFRSHRDVPDPERPRFLFSRGVANYAFTNTEELAKWVTTSRFAILREHFSLGCDVCTQWMGKRFTSFNLSELVRRVQASGRAVNVISYVEASPFLEREPTHSPECVEAFIVIHNLTGDEHERFAEYISAANPSTLSSGFNTHPPIKVVPDLLTARVVNPDVSPVHFPDIQWRRQYVRSVPDDTEYAARFDFSRCYRRTGAASLRDGLASHQHSLEQAYKAALERAGSPARVALRD